MFFDTRFCNEFYVWNRFLAKILLLRFLIRNLTKSKISSDVISYQKINVFKFEFWSHIRRWTGILASNSLSDAWSNIEFVVKITISTKLGFVLKIDNFDFAIWHQIRTHPEISIQNSCLNETIDPKFVFKHKIWPKID